MLVEHDQLPRRFGPTPLERERELVEIARTLRPGGVFLMIDMVRHDREEYRRTMGHLHLGFDAATVQDWADSTGFALYRQPRDGELRLRFFIGEDPTADEAVQRIEHILAEQGAEPIDAERIGNTYRTTVKFAGDLQKFAYALEHAAKVISIGTSLDIIKDVGGAHEVDDTYDVQHVTGT